MSTQFTQGYLKGSSKSSKNINQLITGEYDFFIGSSGWDRRCLSITNSTDLYLNNSLLILFDNKDPLGLQDNHDKILSEFIKEKSKNVKSEKCDSTKVEYLWDKIVYELTAVQDRKKLN